jgi:hypothetical protein
MDYLITLFMFFRKIALVQADLVSANIMSGVRRKETQYMSLLGATLRTQ